MTNTIQKKFKVSSTQLLYQSCPYQALTLFIAGPFLDWCLTDLNVFAFKYTPQVLVRVQQQFSFLLTSSPFPLPNYISLLTWIIFVLLCTVLYCSLLPYFCLSQLQYVSSYWKDFCSYISSPRTSKNMFSFGLWLCSTSRSI